MGTVYPSDDIEPRTTGYCKHGEYDLNEGCPKCLAERLATINQEVHAQAFVNMARSFGIDMTIDDHIPHALVEKRDAIQQELSEVIMSVYESETLTKEKQVSRTLNSEITV